MIIAIAGNREEAGKSTVAKIIQWFTYDNKAKEIFNNDINYFLTFYSQKGDYQIKKFADTLKNFVCTLIDKDRKWLEENKNTKLEGWTYIEAYFMVLGGTEFNQIFSNEKELNEFNDENDLLILSSKQVIKHTPRTLMIQIANNLRETIHPDIWITPLLNQYYTRNYDCEHQECPIDLNCGCENVYPKWIIDDLRYPNEFERLKELGAITIYVERGENKHTRSEGLLDKNDFDFVIDNNGDMSNLIKQVKEIYGKIN